ncbi:MAG: excinuclease ABC subunit UvrC [Elusimicrobia bacterium]|nr:excinuclease ABC subunit UvrC [Elusimicrobiota bacterium]
MMNKYTASMPHAPGVYLMRDYSGKILYVGKAIDLFKRVSSYFNRTNSEPKTAALIANVRVIDYIIADSEKSALILENKLIKKLRPKYNVIWRDDKSYPMICITAQEDFPRLCVARQHQKKDKSAKYFGPFDSAGDIRDLTRYLRGSFNIRPCNYEISENRGLHGCLYFQLGQCPAPCLGKISREDYLKNVQNAQLFLEGRYSRLLSNLKKAMSLSSEKLDYEKSAKYRNNIQSIESMFDKIRFREIKEGDVESNISKSRGLSRLKECLELKKVPVNIEAIDISNIQGKEAVGSLVRFTRGLPDKKNYRKFKIKTVQGVDDYSMMREVVERRYSRLMRNRQMMPDLVLIDGGKGHLDTAKQVFDKLGINNLSLISLAKENEEIHIPGKDKPLILDKDNPALHILQHIRDEAHRFAITYHRKRRAMRLGAVKSVK